MLRSIKTVRHALQPDAGKPSLQERETVCSRIEIEVLTTSGANARLEFRVRRETVELWHREHLAASIDRELLGEWLHDPDEDLICDEAMLTIDWQVDSFGRVALTLPDVSAWTLSPADLDALYRRVTETG